VTVGTLEQIHEPPLSFKNFDQLGGRIVSGSPLMHKDNYLLTHAQDATQVFEDNFIHYVVAPLRVSHLFNAVERAL
jgi:hypothetical protein